jgi:L-ascorbate metabolism protein UlaG (beta-lactamase superfamily)
MAQIKYLGHSCFQITTNNKVIITDPYIRPNDKAMSAGVDFESLRADFILVSHGHVDHTADLQDLARQTGAKVIANWEIHNWLNKSGIEHTHPMNTGGKWDFGAFNIKMVPAVHSSSFEDGTYAGNPVGFVLWNDEDCFYFAGDTALFGDMQWIGEDFQLGFALLPIGDNFTMDSRDALRASNLLRCQQIVGMHYDTFGYIEIDHERSVTMFRESGKQLHLIPINESISL